MPRHWFFKADLFIDGEKTSENLMDIVKSTLTANPGNSVIGFKDNSSAIRWAGRRAGGRAGRQAGRQAARSSALLCYSLYTLLTIWVQT